MKYGRSYFESFSKVLPMLSLLFLGCVVHLSAQTVLFNYEGKYVDYIIPQTTDKYIALTAVGGDGGRIHFKNIAKDFSVGGGKGAFLKAYFTIGNASDQLKPGSTLRFMVGGCGESRLTSGSTGAGGGGGTGIAYKEVGTQNWTLLLVAGGGGGAAFDLLAGRAYGASGLAYVSGKEGDGKGGSGGPNQGGGAGAFGGDEQITAGSTVVKYSLHAKAGWSGGPNAGEPTGGACVGDGPKGGWGFGAGGDGNSTQGFAGGAGGYTGGDINEGNSVLGGTSYVNKSKETSFILPIERGNTNSPESGYASLEIVNESPINSIRFAYSWLLCLYAEHGYTSNGTNIMTYNWSGINAQKWNLEPSDRMIRSIMNINKCLDLDHSNTANGTNIQLWDCNGTDGQKWVYNGLYKTIHSGVNSDKCMDARDGSITSGSVNIWLWSCNYSNNNQKWNIAGATTVSNPANAKYIIPTYHSGFAIHSHTGAESGSNIQLWTNDPLNSALHWYFDGLAIKMRDHQDLCIDLSQGNTSNGNNIQLYNCNGTNAQKWIYDGMTQSIRSVINPDKCMQFTKNTDGVYGKRSNLEIHDCNGTEVQRFLIQE